MLSPCSVLMVISMSQSSSFRLRHTACSLRSSSSSLLSTYCHKQAHTAPPSLATELPPHTLTHTPSLATATTTHTHTPSLATELPPHTLTHQPCYRATTTHAHSHTLPAFRQFFVSCWLDSFFQSTSKPLSSPSTSWHSYSGDRGNGSAALLREKRYNPANSHTSKTQRTCLKATFSPCLCE